MIYLFLIVKKNLQGVCTRSFNFPSQDGQMAAVGKVLVTFPLPALKITSVKRTTCSQAHGLSESPSARHRLSRLLRSLNLERQGVTRRAHWAGCGVMASCPSPSHLCSILLPEPWQGGGDELSHPSALWVSVCQSCGNKVTALLLQNGASRSKWWEIGQKSAVEAKERQPAPPAFRHALLVWLIILRVKKNN